MTKKKMRISPFTYLDTDFNYYCLWGVSVWIDPYEEEMSIRQDFQGIFSRWSFSADSDCFCGVHICGVGALFLELIAPDWPNYLRIMGYSVSAMPNNKLEIAEAAAFNWMLPGDLAFFSNKEAHI